ncbi:MAG: GGDEF domain-containing protein [Gammaproteobacteria bacterium]|nr:GGDEF domain-containing protein [Gammaproteobacteria bacterium]
MKYTFTRISHLIQLSTFLSLVFAGLGVYLLINNAISHYQTENYTLRAGNLATQIESRISAHHAQLTLLARQPRIQALAGQGLAERRAVENQLQNSIASATRVRFLSADSNTVDTSEVPHFDYACLGMLKGATQNLDVPVASVHMLNTPSAHIALVKAIVGADNGVHGYLLLTLDPKLLQDILDQQAPEAGYAELRIGSTTEAAVLAAYGDERANLAQYPGVEVPVGYTSWKIFYAQKPAQWSLAAQGSTIFVYFGLAVLLLLVGPYLIQNLMQKTIQRDIKTLAAMVADIRTGKIAADYPVRLKELSLVAVQLLRSGGKLVQDQQALLKDGHVDMLTGVATRTAFKVRLEQLHDHAKLGFPSSLLLIDIEGLSRINDTIGHQGGDRLLREFAEHLRQNLRQNDFIARLGGGKFGIIFSLTPLTETEPVITRLKGKIPFEIDLAEGMSVEANWSGGLSVTSKADKDPATVMARANTALTEAKNAGGNQININPGPAGQAPVPKAPG